MQNIVTKALFLATLEGVTPAPKPAPTGTGWTLQFRRKITDECISAGVQQNVPPSVGAVYCACVLGALEKAVPSADPADIATYSKTPPAAAVMQQCAAETRKFIETSK
jgi:hypothetical protein